MQDQIPNRPIAAASAMLVSMLVIGFIDNFIYGIAGTIGLWQFFVLRMICALPLIWMLSRIGLGQIVPLRWVRVAARSFFVASALLFYFGALAFMPIAQALAGLFTSPIFVLLIGWGVMGQRIGPWRVVAVALGFGGILLVLQPDSGAFSWVTLMPVFGGFLYALGALATRHWCAGESTVAMLGGVMMMQGMIGAVALAVLGLFGLPVAEGADGFITRGWVWEMGGIWHLIALQVVGSVGGVFLIIKSYQLGEPSYVAVFEYSIMIFGPMFAWLLFGQTLGPIQGIGIALIALAGIIIAVRSA